MATPNVLRRAKMHVYKQKAEMEVYKVKFSALVLLSQRVIGDGVVCNLNQRLAKVILFPEGSIFFFSR